MSIELVMPSSHLIFCCLLLLPSVSVSIRVFSSESVLHIRYSKYLSFSISPSNDYSGLISFRIDGFHLLAVEGTLKRLLQHHSLKASVLQHSAFFMVKLSHPYMTTGKTIALIIWTFVGKVMSLLFNTLLRFQFSSIQSSPTFMSDSLWPSLTAADQASLSFTISQNLLKLMSFELVMPSNNLILCQPLVLPPSIFPRIRVFPVSQVFA